MPLAYLQQRLQNIYELDIAQNVNDYLITNNNIADNLARDESHKDRKEKLLVIQGNDDLLLSLYLDAGIVKKLREDDPVMCLHSGNLEDFCLALEGISHFLYLIWNATYERSVTLLEMELQAEIDKFIMLAICMEQQYKRPVPGQLRRLLFEAINYHEGMSADEVQRYSDANKFAEKYCWYLESSYFRKGKEQELIKELRRFYRLNQDGKLRRISYLH